MDVGKQQVVAILQQRLHRCLADGDFGNPVAARRSNWRISIMLTGLSSARINMQAGSARPRALHATK
jgi:hypothetical protein